MPGIRPFSTLEETKLRRFRYLAQRSRRIRQDLNEREFRQEAVVQRTYAIPRPLHVRSGYDYRTGSFYALPALTYHQLACRCLGKDRERFHLCRNLSSVHCSLTVYLRRLDRLLLLLDTGSSLSVRNTAAKQLAHLAVKTIISDVTLNDEDLKATRHPLSLVDSSAWNDLMAVVARVSKTCIPDLRNQTLPLDTPLPPLEVL